MENISNNSKIFKNILWLLPAFFLTIVIFFPIVWMVLCSFRSNLEIFTFPPRIIPKNFTIEAYYKVVNDHNFLRAIFNTIFVSGVTTFFSLILSTSAAYGFSRFNFYAKKTLQHYILSTQMIPTVLLVLPFFLVLSKLNLYDSYLGLIISYTSFTLPFCTLTMIGFYNKIPIELDEAALIDGCSRLTAFFRVILPVSMTGFLATAIFAFIYAWNEYLMAVVLVSSETMRMLSVVIGSKIGQFDIRWNELMAITVFASIPLVLIYAFLQRYFVKGMTAGGVKM